MSEENGKELPEGWTTTPFLAVTSHHSGDSTIIKGRLSTEESPHSFPAFSATGQDVWRDEYADEGDAIIVSAVGARCGKCFLAFGKWSAIANTHVVWPESGGVHTRFLWYRLNDERFWVRSGTAQPFVVVRKTLERPFDLPPLPEQTRIADKLDELFSDLDAGVAALEGVRGKLKRYRAAVLKAAVEGALTARWRAENPAAETADALLTRILAERRRRWEETQLQKFADQGKPPPKNWKTKYKQPAAPDTTNLPPLPEGWCWATVEQLSIEVRNGYSTKPDASNGVPILRISSVRPFSLDLTDRRFLSGTAADYENDQIETGDLLFTRYNGSRNLVGVCAVVPTIEERIVHPDKLIRARPVSSEFSSHFTGLAANVGLSRKYIEQRIRTTAGQAGISGGDVRSLPIPLPPLAEQTAIVEAVEAQLSVIDRLEADLDAKLKSAQALRQSILRDAFAGRLVPQDPADEPASELLKRIAAEREERARSIKAAKSPKLSRRKYSVNP